MSLRAVSRRGSRCMVSFFWPVRFVAFMVRNLVVVCPVFVGGGLSVISFTP